MKKLNAVLPKAFEGATDGVVNVSVQAKGTFEHTFSRQNFLTEAGVVADDAEKSVDVSRIVQS